jgi:hypothetical protein
MSFVSARRGGDEGTRYSDDWRRPNRALAYTNYCGGGRGADNEQVSRRRGKLRALSALLLSQTDKHACMHASPAPAYFPTFDFHAQRPILLCCVVWNAYRALLPHFASLSAAPDPPGFFFFWPISIHFAHLILMRFIWCVLYFHFLPH